eukprot:5340272-Prymnesium_polylepis.1
MWCCYWRRDPHTREHRLASRARARPAAGHATRPRPLRHPHPSWPRHGHITHMRANTSASRLLPLHALNKMTGSRPHSGAVPARSPSASPARPHSIMTSRAPASHSSGPRASIDAKRGALQRTHAAAPSSMAPPCTKQPESTAAHAARLSVALRGT